MINKLLLVRVNNSSSTLPDELGIKQFVKGEPLNVSPRTWHEESGLSHYGYVLQGLKLKDLKDLEKQLLRQDNISLHNMEEGDTVDMALSNVGLRINKEA